MLRNAFAAAFAALFVVLVLGIALMTTQAGVDLVVRELAARSGGALEIDGASGTLLDTVRARRIAWRGAATKVEATDVALTWRPWSVFSRGVLVHALGARALTIDIEPAGASESDTTLA